MPQWQIKNCRRTASVYLKSAKFGRRPPGCCVNRALAAEIAHRTAPAEVYILPKNERAPTSFFEVSKEGRKNVRHTMSDSRTALHGVRLGRAVAVRLYMIVLPDFNSDRAGT